MTAPGGSDGPSIGAGVLPEAPTTSPAPPAAPAATGGTNPVRTIVVPGLLTVLFLALAVFCGRRGIVTDTWPAFLPGADSTAITRYVGPWLTAAALALLGAGLSVLALIRGLRARGSRT